jgi:F-type H+-transporting ATPase subunit b
MLDININLLWQIINFLIVMYVLNRFLFKPVGETLRKRQEDIKSLYQKIDDEKKEAERLKAFHDEKIKKIELEIDELKRVEIKAMHTQREEIIEEARKNAQLELNKGISRLEIETKKELDKLQDYLSDLSIQIAAKILKEEINPEKHKKMIGEFIQKVGDIEWQKR